MAWRRVAGGGEPVKRVSTPAKPAFPGGEHCGATPFSLPVENIARLVKTERICLHFFRVGIMMSV